MAEFECTACTYPVCFVVVAGRSRDGGRRQHKWQQPLQHNGEKQDLTKKHPKDAGNRLKIIELLISQC